MNQLTVPGRFCGPPVSGNGGYTAGAVAELVPDARTGDRTWQTVEVSLRRPPPLDTPLPVTHRDAVTIAGEEGAVVADGKLYDGRIEAIEPVDVAEARDAVARYPGYVGHPFPTCVGCGPDRAVGDGLRLFPGRVADQDGAARVAATWTPHPSMAGEDTAVSSLPVLWCALDCVGAWASDFGDRPLVLARMRARVDELPRIGEEHVLMGLARGQEGRKTFSLSGLYDSDGRLVGCAEHLWIAVDPADFS